MAKKAAKRAVKKKPAPQDDSLSGRVAKFMRSGDHLHAASLVAAANPTEAQFDALMAEHEGLREAFHKL